MACNFSGRAAASLALTLFLLLPAWTGHAQEQTQEQAQAQAQESQDMTTSQTGATSKEQQSAPTDIDRILQDEQLRIGLQEAFQRKSKLRQPDVDITRITTMFFTRWQHALLQEAKARFTTRAPDQGEVSVSETGDPDKRIKGPREIRLGGISYVGPSDWTVWLNGERITPNAIPKEVIDIKVAGEFIELKWFDSYLDLIFPVRLRPHQRFNLDSRIFLPGEGAPQ